MFNNIENNLGKNESLGDLGINIEKLKEIKKNPKLRKAFLTMAMTVGIFTSVEMNSQTTTKNEKSQSEIIANKKENEKVAKFTRKDFIRPEEVTKVEKLDKQNLLNLDGEYSEVIISRYNGYGGWSLAGMYSDASALDVNEYNSGIYKVTLKNNTEENILYFEKDISSNDDVSIDVDN